MVEPVPYDACAHAEPEADVCSDNHLNYMEEDVHNNATSPAGREDREDEKRIAGGIKRSGETSSLEIKVRTNVISILILYFF